MQDHELKEHIMNGYYAFQDYAVSYWFDHMKSSLETSHNGPIDTQNSLYCQLSLFLEDYGTFEKRELLRNSNAAEIFHCIPQDFGVWSQWFDLEWRTSRIRDAIESLGNELDFGDANRDLKRQIYGPERFKCPKIGCDHFTTGFSSRLLRDGHLNRHDRPFICIENHCPFQTLGFETNAQLESHMGRTHPGTGTDRFAFPQPIRRKDDSIHKASARGDFTAVKNFIDSGADINSTSRPYGGETPLFLAARNSHLNICKMLLENGADANFQAPRAARFTALHEAVRYGNAEIVEYFVSLGNMLPSQTNGDAQSPPHATKEANSEALAPLLFAAGKVDTETKDGYSRTPLLLAVHRENEMIIKLLLAKGRTDANAKDRWGRTPLRVAVEIGNETIIKLLLATGKIDADAKDSDGRTPLLVAAKKGEGPIVKLLLATGKVDPDVKDEDGRTLLSRAAESGAEEVVKLLLATDKVDPAAQDTEGRTPLSRAAKKGGEEVVKLLLATGKVDPGAKDLDGQTPLSRAAEAGAEEVVKLLLATGKVDPDAKDEDGRTLLSRAAESGAEEVVKLLLATDKVDPDAKDKEGRTPLSKAAATGREEVVKLLLATGKVDPDVEDKHGITPLGALVRQIRDQWLFSLPRERGGNLSQHDYLMQLMLLEQQNKKRMMMARYGHDQTLSRKVMHESATAIVNLLLATSKANPDARDEDGRTPLSIAAEVGVEPLVELLLSTGEVDPDAKDKDGRTPLSWAAKNGGEGIVEVLLATGRVDPDVKDEVVKLLLATGKVDPDARDKNGRTPLSRAAEAGAEEVIKLLLATGKVDPDVKDEDGRTPLSRAVEAGAKEVVKLLLATGKVDPNAKDTEGRTPLSRAAKNGREEVVELLLATGKVDFDTTEDVLENFATGDDGGSSFDVLENFDFDSFLNTAGDDGGFQL
jgi:ankyrin repeat protein